MYFAGLKIGADKERVEKGAALKMLTGWLGTHMKPKLKLVDMQCRSHKLDKQ